MIISAFIGWLAWGWINAVRGVARTAPLMYLMPPVAGLVAWALTGERYSAVKVAGAALTLAGVALAQFGSSPRDPVRETPGAGRLGPCARRAVARRPALGDDRGWTGAAMKHLPLPATGLVVAVALALAACSKAPDPAAPAALRLRRRPPRPSRTPAVADAADGIAWKKASSDADIEAAFAIARAETKPVFLYWGAKWCPPCNQVQATLFNRQDFIERSRAFVPVYVDGDSPGRAEARHALSRQRLSDDA